MRRFFTHAAVFVGALAIGGGAAHGAGFELQEVGAKAMGMANAYTGYADDASSVFFNPAAIAHFKGLGGLVTMTYIDAHAYHDTDEQSRGQTDQRTNNKAILIPASFGVLGMEVSDTIRLGAGFGVFTPYGLSLDWSESEKWGGRFQVTRSSIAVIEPNLNVAGELKLSDDVSIAGAFGMSLLFGKLVLKRRLDFNSAITPGAGEADLKFNLDNYDSPGWRWNVAGMVRLFDNKLRIGVSYRDNARHAKLYGRTKIANIPAAVAGSIPTSPNRTKLGVRLPGSLRIGVSGDPIKPLTISFDWRHTNWSVASAFPISSELSLVNGRKLELEYRDSDFFALGTEYRVMTYDDDELGLALRTGIYWDGTPIPRNSVNPLLPGNNRYGFSVGLGLEPVKGMTIDLAYMAVHFEPFRSSNSLNAPSTSGNGRYRTWANLFALSLGLAF